MRIKKIALFAGLCSCLIAGLIASPSSSKQIATGKVPFSGCYVYGNLLAGKVQVVTSPFGSPTDRVPTYKVQVVNAFPDLKVKSVNAFPSRCGEWQFVSSFPKFKIRYVNSFPDFTIKMVSSFPGR